MKILFCGDVVGRSGRKVLDENLPKIQKEYDIDFTIVNCDNASGGFGVNKNTYQELIDLGANVLTGGDHIWDQVEINSFLPQSDRLLRPLNFPDSNIGVGARVFANKKNQKVLVVHLLGQVFIKYQVDCPFAKVEALLKNHVLAKDVAAIFVDFHAEATSEKMAMGKFLDGRVSAVVGSHTHIPTNDCHIMKDGTAYQTDAGMCGDYNSVIGMEANVPLKAFLQKHKSGRMTPAQGPATLCGTIVEIDDVSGLAKKIFPIKLGGIL